MFMIFVYKLTVSTVSAAPYRLPLLQCPLKPGSFASTYLVYLYVYCSIVQ